VLTHNASSTPIVRVTAKEAGLAGQLVEVQVAAAKRR
jgi:hypothetical protein